MAMTMAHAGLFWWALLTGLLAPMGLNAAGIPIRAFAHIGFSAAISRIPIPLGMAP